MALPDALVYDWSVGGKCRPTAQLYGLTDEEIKSVESLQMPEATRPLDKHAGPDAGR